MGGKWKKGGWLATIPEKSQLVLMHSKQKRCIYDQRVMDTVNDYGPGLACICVSTDVLPNKNGLIN